MGGGRISGAPEAPEKYMAANDLTRVYDLEHARFQIRERRNMLFPFLAPFGHSFALNDNRIDGVHMRRMWMMNNPVALVRAMLDPAAKLGAPRQTGGVTAVDVTLKEGDT